MNLSCLALHFLTYGFAQDTVVIAVDAQICYVWYLEENKHEGVQVDQLLELLVRSLCFHLAVESRDPHFLRATRRYLMNFTCSS